MRKQTSLEKRELIIKFHKKGKLLREIASVIDRSHITVKKIIDKLE